MIFPLCFFEVSKSVGNLKKKETDETWASYLTLVRRFSLIISL